ncbi:hypothetical protein EXM65_14525, partial [Clostridium botulinum]|nr:hypothetical protein [Clostridium botulinum]
ERPKDKSQLEFWEKCVSCKWIKPELVETNIKHSICQNNISTTSSAVQLNENTIYKNDISTTSSAVEANENIVDESLKTSSNWAGFAVEGPVKSVMGAWSVPKVKADSAHRPAKASQWVGLGGRNGQKTLVQAGTECSVDKDGSTKYDTWYELYGTNHKDGYSVDISNMSYEPGDRMLCDIGISRSSKTMKCKFFLCNTDKDEKTSFEVSVTDFPDVPNSAEWIVETPTVYKDGDKKGVQYNYPVTTDVETGKKTIRFGLCSYGLNNDDYTYVADKSYSGHSPYVKASHLNLVPIQLIGKNTGNVIAAPKKPGSLIIDYMFPIVLSHGQFNVDWMNYN